MSASEVNSPGIGKRKKSVKKKNPEPLSKVSKSKITLGALLVITSVVVSFLLEFSAAEL